jgi:hypothetical protein
VLPAGPIRKKRCARGTRDYRVCLREKVAEVIKAGGALDDVYQVDQSAELNLHTAGRVYRAMASSRR